MSVLFSTILLVILLTGVLFVIKIPTIVKGRMKYRTKWKVVVIYVAVLSIFPFIYWFLVPTEANVTEPTAEEAPSLVDYVFDPSRGPLPEEYIKEEWEIMVEDQSIQLLFDSGVYYQPVLVVVKEREVLDNVATATLYETPTMVEHLDISEHVPLGTYKTVGNELRLTREDDSIELKYYSIDKEFPILPFTEDPIGYQNRVDIGEQVIQLTVPKETRVHADEDAFDVLQ